MDTTLTRRRTDTSDDESLTNTDKLLAASDTLGQLSDNLAKTTEGEQETALALQIESVRLFLTELTAYLIDGIDPHEAMRKAAKGEMKV